MFVIEIKNGIEPILQTVLEYTDDKVFVDEASYYGVPQQEWRKFTHLQQWVINNRPNWNITIIPVKFEVLLKAAKDSKNQVAT
jgi:hypothetical protein